MRLGVVRRVPPVAPKRQELPLKVVLEIVWCSRLSLSVKIGSVRTLSFDQSRLCRLEQRSGDVLAELVH